MNVRLISYPQNAKEIIMLAAAICTGQNPTPEGMLVAIESGHHSILEHVSFSFIVENVSRALLAQLTRHRIASYSVESQRYVNMRDMPVVIPLSIVQDEEMLEEFTDIMSRIKSFYHKAVKRGIPKEDARFATPAAACTRLLFTMNVRELLHFLSLRECNKAQWEIRQLAEIVLAICKPHLPDVFITAGAPCRRGVCPEKRPCKQGPKTRTGAPDGNVSWGGST